jgi:hypothetical protein
MKSSKTSPSPSDIENARIGYQVASELSAFYGSAIWSMFNAMLLANSIVVAGLTFIFTSQNSLWLLKILLLIIGLLLCVTWFLLTKRSHEYSNYYTLSAREIEESYLGENVKTLSRGGLFGSGQAVKIKIGGVQTTHRMSILARLVKGQSVAYIIILIFIALYIGIFFQI